MKTHLLKTFTREIVSKKSVIFTSALFCGAILYGQNNIGNIDDRCKTTDYRVVDGWGEYPVQSGQSTDIHDPRIERKNLKRIEIGDSRTFEATYQIVNAKNTTFAQILNQDSRSSDKHKPVVFITADPSGNRWKIRDQRNDLCTVGKNEVFVLRVDTYYNSSKTKCFSKIYINGELKTTKTHARVGQNSQMRYGAYHHGSGTAVIRVKDVTWQTTAEYLAGGGGGGNNKAPSVSVTSPENNAVFSLGETVPMGATASDSDGSITKVNFKVNGSYHSQDATGPAYNSSFTPESVGTYKIAARAFDNDGSSTEKEITITVTGPRDCNGTPGGSAKMDDCGVCSGGTTGLQVDACNKCETVYASSSDDNVASNVLDGDLNTRWSAEGPGEFIEFCMDEETTLKSISIAFHKGDERTSSFDLAYSLDGISYTNILNSVTSSGTSLEMEDFSFDPVKVKKLRITGKGNSKNAWNSISEVEWAELITSTSADITAEKLTVFPNPSESGVFSLQNSVKWEVYTIQGKLTTQGTGREVNISSQPSGMYILKADNKEIKIRKI